ncbi:hypothetical protein [Acinetobacter silvestris]|uniref:Uncharacterized protein n=1 Tax=Acinetobacter silvestris TaxID=1977882 RepID=A0A1Y3CL31_9GAMM|nr:hypothetical protein [Acinetobacter silvestris]OTG65835.1 hypothetical protein B9T28_06445 [Acinetobacter silvestris]
MNQGIPTRDMMVNQNGQITAIWLIFFERLYSIYSNASEGNAEAFIQIKEIANQALELAQQNQSTHDSQQKQIEKLHKLVTDSVAGFATTQDLATSNKRIDQTEHDIQQLQKALEKLKATLKDSQKETKDKLSNLQEQINNITLNYILEAPIDGKTYGRKDSDWSEIVVVNLSFPFFLSDGVRQNIPLTSDFQLPFFLSDGTQQNIQMVVI